jgi:hypothetical protein
MKQEICQVCEMLEEAPHTNLDCIKALKTKITEMENQRSKTDMEKTLEYIKRKEAFNKDNPEYAEFMRNR